MAVAAEAKLLKEDVKANDIDILRKRLDSVNSKYAELEKESKSIYWAAFIPYVNDFKSGIEAGHYTLIAADEAVEAIYPYADLIGFKKGEQNFYADDWVWDFFHFVLVMVKEFSILPLQE